MEPAFFTRKSTVFRTQIMHRHQNHWTTNFSGCQNFATTSFLVGATKPSTKSLKLVVSTSGFATLILAMVFDDFEPYGLYNIPLVYYSEDEPRHKI